MKVINASAQPGRRGDKDSKARILFALFVCDCSCDGVRIWIHLSTSVCQDFHMAGILMSKEQINKVRLSIKTRVQGVKSRSESLAT